MDLIDLQERERETGKIENAVKIVATSERFSNNQK